MAKNKLPPFMMAKMDKKMSKEMYMKMDKTSAKPKGKVAKTKSKKGM